MKKENVILEGATQYPIRRVYTKSFQKSPEERALLQTMKHLNKTAIVNEFGHLPKKVLNTTNKQLPKVTLQF